MATVVREAPSMNDVRDEIFRLMGGLGRQTIGPKDLLTWARKNPDSAAHRWLTLKKAFDKAHAAEAFALLLCRQLLIRVRVKLINPETDDMYSVRALVSLERDRGNENGSYRRTDAVISTEALRKELLSEAKKELLAFQRKYNLLSELSPLWQTIGAMLAGG